MNYRVVLNILGKVLVVEAILLLFPAAAALWYDEPIEPFLYTMLPLLILGGVLNHIRPKSNDLFAREGFVVVGLSWVLMSAFGALPFVFSGDIPRYIDALFETVSGFTTTGSSILTDVEAMSRGCMTWRLFTHWVGGMGVLVFIAAILPISGDHYIHVMRAEVPGPTVSKLVPKARKTARILYMIYAGLTFLEFLFLLCGGMNFHEAILHAFATAGTGGFSTRGASIAAFESVYIEMVVAVFMMLFGVNFNLFYFILLGQGLSIFKSEELRVYLALMFGSTLVIALNIMHSVGGFGQGLRYAYFQVATVMSTTGFATYDFDKWPELSRWLLVLLMFGGACAGSTAGGLKISRVIILFKSYLYELKQLILPTRVKRIWFEGKAVSDQTVRSVLVYFQTYIGITGLSVLLLALDGHDLVTNLTASIACISNIGPGLGLVGPTGNFAFFSTPSKLVLIFEMLLGRLEIFPMMFLFAPSVWRKR